MTDRDARRLRAATAVAGATLGTAILLAGPITAAVAGPSSGTPDNAQRPMKPPSTTKSPTTAAPTTTQPPVTTPPAQTTAAAPTNDPIEPVSTKTKNHIAPVVPVTSKATQTSDPSTADTTGSATDDSDVFATAATAPADTSLATPTAPAAPAGGSSGTSELMLGAAAAVIAVGGAGALLLRSRRRSADEADLADEGDEGDDLDEEDDSLSSRGRTARLTSSANTSGPDAAAVGPRFGRVVDDTATRAALPGLMAVRPATGTKALDDPATSSRPVGALDDAAAEPSASGGWTPASRRTRSAAGNGAAARKGAAASGGGQGGANSAAGAAGTDAGTESSSDLTFPRRIRPDGAGASKPSAPGPKRVSIAGPLEPEADIPDPHRADPQLPTVRHRPPYVPGTMRSYDVPGAADATTEIPRQPPAPESAPESESDTMEIPRQAPAPERNFDLRPGVAPPSSPNSWRRPMPPVNVKLPADELPPEQGPGPVF
jgi:hypothetical protein